MKKGHNNSPRAFVLRTTAYIAVLTVATILLASGFNGTFNSSTARTNTGRSPSNDSSTTQERTATASSQPVEKDSDALEKLSAIAGMPRPVANPKFSGQPLVPTSAPYNVGDVFIGVGLGFIKHFSPSGVLLDTLNTGTGCREDTGMAFTSTSHLLATTFGCGVVEFDDMGNLIGPFGSGYNTDTESVVIDAAHNVYIGQADGTRALKKFDSTGTFLMNFFPATQNRGTDWNDLAADQCTMFYTSEGTAIKRFNVCTNTQLSDFATSAAFPKYALRIRANGEVIVAATRVLERYDPSGTLIQTYTFPGSLAFAMNVDPDGTHFWTADYFTGTVYKYDIATGTIVLSFPSSPLSTAAGLAVFGERTVAHSPTPTATAMATATPTPSPTARPRPVTITVKTNPAGLSYSVDGVTYTTAKSFSWKAGTTHTLATTSPQTLNGNTYVWQNWSDGGAISHLIAPTMPTAYTANFLRQ